MKRKGHGDDAKVKKCISVPDASEKTVFQIWNHPTIYTLKGSREKTH